MNRNEIIAALTDRAESVVYEAAAIVAKERGLPAGWLNDAVKGFLAGDDPAATPVLDLPGLRCFAASPRTLLALKVLAHRVGEDEDDLRLLAHELGLERADEILAVAEETFGDRLEPAARQRPADAGRIRRGRLGPACSTPQGDRHGRWSGGRWWLSACAFS